MNAPEPEHPLKVLVMGANGRTGRAIVHALARRGAAVRGFVRDPHRAGQLLTHGAAELAVGDMANPASVRRALSGCDAAVFIGPPMHPGEVDFALDALTAAEEIGLRRFVYYSVMHPQLTDVPHHARKLVVEQRLAASPVPHVVVQPSRYMQHLETIWDEVLETGRHRMPFGVDVEFSVVDLIDVAEATARVAIEEGHDFATYQLAGPERLSQRQMARALSEALGRAVEAEPLPPEDAVAAAHGRGADERRLANVLAMNAHYDTHGFRGNANVLRWLLEREPTRYSRYVARLADERRGTRQAKAPQHA